MEQYERTVRVVSALLYAFDPDGMGQSIFAPSDEYDEAASKLVAESRQAEDLQQLLSERYSNANEQMVGAIVDVLDIFLESPSSQTHP